MTVKRVNYTQEASEYFLIIILVMLISLSCEKVFCQQEISLIQPPSKDVNLSFILKATLDIAPKQPHRGKYDEDYGNNFGQKSFINVSAVLGAGYLPSQKSAVYPFIHVGASIYTEGSLASSYDAKHLRGLDHPAVELMFSPGFSAGVPLTDRQLSKLNERARIPFFSTVYPAVLESPFGAASIQMAWNRVWASNRSASQSDYKALFQHIGYIGATLNRMVSAGTYNDGSFMYWRPLRQIFPGDGYDRFYSGGGHLTFHLPASKDGSWVHVDQIELSGDRFTGHDPHVYSTGNALLMHYTLPGYPVARVGKTQRNDAYNKGRLKVNFSNLGRAVDLGFTLHNLDWDFQHFLHRRGKYTYHADRFVKKDNNFFSQELSRIGFNGSLGTFETLR